MDPSFFDVALEDLADRVWSALTRASADPSHDWHWPTVSTIDQGRPRARTVVLRDVEAPHLVFHTDLRTPKVTQLRENPSTEWHFYDSGSRVQLRARGESKILTDVEEIWDKISPANRANYCARQPPGTGVDERTDGLGDERQNPTPENTRHGRENFAVVETTVEAFDWLWLSRGEHRRASLDLENDAARWLIP